jgi:hypothetical protein
MAMYRSVFLYLTILFLSFSSCDQYTGELKVLNAEDYGISKVNDATPILRKVLNDSKNSGINKIIFPKGEYHFYDEKAIEKYCAVSNNDNGLKRIAFQLEGFDQLEIDANGSSFVFHGLIVPFNIENSSNITIKNLSVDYDKPFYGQGEVVSVNPDDHTFDLKIADDWEYVIHENNLYFKNARDVLNIQRNIWFDPETKSPVYNVDAYQIDPWNKWINDNYEAYEVEEGIVRIKQDIAKLPEKGWFFVCKGDKNTRLVPGFRIYDAANITLENITIYHSGAMGLIAEKSENIFMNGLNVHLKENSERIVSTVADATHFVNCKGLVRFENCTFKNMLDDATNVHGIYTKLTDIVDSYTIGVKTIHYQQWGFDFASAGDTVLLSNPQTLEAYKKLVVQDVKNLNEEYMELTFSEKIDDIAMLNSGVENISWQADMIMRNCNVDQNRARSILISTRGDVLVEDCYFSSMMAAILFAGDMNYWFESGPVRNVTIRNNTFENHCSGGKGNTVFKIDPIIPNPDKKEDYFHHNIKITNNTIRTFDRGILHALSVKNLTFSNNIIQQTTDLPPLNPDKPVIKIEHCKGVKIEGNEYNWDKAADVSADSESIEHINFNNNKGFENDIQILTE